MNSKHLQAKPDTLLLIQFSSVNQSCQNLCNPMNHSMPGLPVHHHLPESTQTHVPWVDDAIQPSHTMLSPSPPALNLSQHQGPFQWVNSLHQVAKVLEYQLQHQSVHETQNWSPLGWTGWISLQSKGSQESSPSTQIESTNSLASNLLCGPVLTFVHG